MRGGGRGGGGRAPSAAAAADGAAAGDAATIPPASRKLVQGLKGILTDRSEAEIYATLLDCGMDPDVAVDRLISQTQDPFHEVRRKRDKKKEIKGAQETRPRPFYKSAFRGSKTGSDRSGHFHSGFGGDSTGSGKGPTKKETALHSLPNSSASDSVKESNPTEKRSAADHATTNDVSSGQADANSTILQPPSQVKHGWGGMSGRPSMADIVKRGRSQVKPVTRPVASNTGAPIVGSSVISNSTNHNSKDSQNLVSPSEVDSVTTDKIPNGTNKVSPDVLPPKEGLEVPESVAAGKPEPSTADVNTDEVEEDTNLDKNEEMSAEGPTSSGPYTASSKEIQSEYTQIATNLNNDLIVETNERQSDSNAFEHNRDPEGIMSATDNQFEQLTLHEEKRSKSSEDNPAVIIPDHLQVSNADCAHLTFGSFVSGTLDAPVSLKPANSDEEVAAVSDNHLIDQSDARIHEYENKDIVEPAADEHVAAPTKSDTENLDMTPVQQPELGTADLMDVTNSTVYNLSSTSDYATSSAVQPDSSSHIYMQEHRQLQNISPLSSFMQGNIPNGLLAPALPPLRDFDPAFSLLLTNPPLATMVHGTAPSSMGNATTASTQPQEIVNPGASSNPQLSQSQPSTSTSIASGPPLPQHLALHPYAQATLPLGYASMIGYPSLPQSYAYLPPAAFQQPYMNSGLFHQAAAAVPNSNVKYPLPQYKSNVPLASLPQPASLLSSYVGGFGAASSMPGNFAMNQSTPSATAAPGYDGTVPAQYKDGNHFVSLQQSENPAMWMHGAGSRTMPPLAANALYGYQGQGHHGGLRQGQLPSQFGATLGQSQPGLSHDHRNPSDGNLSAAAAQANQMWPNSY
uniref:GBF-interacting protein 1 N-terminal domain-containing protein n=1 Tax=Leersia perrieri TaxID=77586 RepID=A0A0D9WK92_9ORYZ